MNFSRWVLITLVLRDLLLLQVHTSDGLTLTSAKAYTSMSQVRVEAQIAVWRDNPVDKKGYLDSRALTLGHSMNLLLEDQSN